MIEVRGKYNTAKIYTDTADSATVDESPMAYKPMDEILANIEPTANVLSRLVPIYNCQLPTA